MDKAKVYAYQLQRFVGGYLFAYVKALPHMLTLKHNARCWFSRSPNMRSCLKLWLEGAQDRLEGES